MELTTVSFPSRAASAFVRDVKADVAAYFETGGRSSKRNWRTWVKTLLLFGVSPGTPPR